MNRLIKTVKKTTSVEYEEKKSRFLGAIYQVNKEKEASEIIAKARSIYWDATHNVYAYYICNGNIFQKYSDDGEPSGTAGLPVLNVIKHSELQNVCIVVTRYFGGILLGAGGLARAYGKCASLVVNNADVVTKKMCRIVKLEIDYKYIDKIKNFLEIKEYRIDNIEYLQNVKITCFVPSEEAKFLKNEVLGLTNGNIAICIENEIIV